MVQVMTEAWCPLGPGVGQAISHRHARIRYNPGKTCFELSALSRAGAYLDGQLVLPEHGTREVKSRQLIQVGSRCFFFLPAQRTRVFCQSKEAISETSAPKSEATLELLQEAIGFLPKEPKRRRLVGSLGKKPIASCNSSNVASDFGALVSLMASLD
eukprot:TRINITY_DN32530_c0_g1_i1.p1 TRINITY_DN32530_c0_g1~~TRINITY_DN32530_c0_g1_i1.p1  ORF type:complete len:157 (+),score=7.59 TRINITY_DN32530_c0_g1_i1:69-539(+)